MNGLTDRAFWLNYWENKTGLVFRIPDNYPFLSLLEELVNRAKAKDLLEIGGFPGYYSVWAEKKLGVKATLLDFVIHPGILHALEDANDVPQGTIGTLEADLFGYTPAKQFDLVMSNGLIEHFQDTSDIIERHLSFLKTDGTLFISLPNFQGVNGWFQKNFDKGNYDKHFIDCMDITFLSSTCKKLGLKEVKVYYSGRFMLWLENEKEQPATIKLFKKVTWLVFKTLTKIIPFESRALSPYIIITAKK